MDEEQAKEGRCNMTVQLSMKQIFEKEFQTSFRGYAKEEVDDFLDIIMKDYDAFQKKIALLESEIERLERGEKQPGGEPRATRTAQQESTVAAGTTNFDILKRISNLEKHVFGDKLVNDHE